MNLPVDITTKLAVWSDALRALGQTGLAFEPHAYDRERYEALLSLAAEMAASVNGGAALDPELAEQLAIRWRADVRAGVPGYVTPKVGVGAIVFDPQDRILLIQREDSGGWLYPTGWLDVSLTPAETAVKEVAEETGIQVEADRLLGVFDGSHRRYRLNFHMVSVMVYCRLVGGELIPHPVEVLDVGFFARHELPHPLLRADAWVEEVFDFHHGLRRPILD